MKRSRLAAALALALGAACVSEPPRIPFQEDGSSWHGVVLASDWVVNKDFGENTQAVGAEMIMEPPGTGSWAWEMGMRYGSGDSDGKRRVQTGGSLIVDSEREIQFYEVDLGVRQYYRLLSRFQPYFGIGGSILYAQSEEQFQDPNTIPPTNLIDHERSEYRPGIYGRVGLVWNMLRHQLRESTEFPLALDVRGLLSVDYSYLEFSLSFGWGTSHY